MIQRIILALILFALPAGAVDMITGTITLTNTPNGNTNTITVNGSTRTWTNSITASPSTLIKETNSVTLSTTNLLNHLSLYPPVAGQILSQTTASNVVLRALPGRSLTITIAGLWAYVTYATNTVTDAIIVRVPITVEASTNQTNIASLLVNALNLSTNSLATNAIAGSNYVTRGAHAGQTIASSITISSNLTVAGAIRAHMQLFATNGFTSALTNINPVFSNAVNYGNALSSVGDVATAEQFGSGAHARAAGDTAIGASSLATNGNATVVGTSGQANNGAVGIGNLVNATGTNSVAIGNAARATMEGNILIGDGIDDDNHQNVIGIGHNVTITTSNAVTIGSSSQNIVVGGPVVAATMTNTTFKGTNRISGRVDFAAGTQTGLANGYNSGTVLGTNVYLRVSGPTAAYTNAGFSAAVDGTWHKLQFDNPGLSYTILDNSGLDATAANRVYTGTGALINSTNNPVFAELIYDGAASRWRVIAFR